MEPRLSEVQVRNVHVMCRTRAFLRGQALLPLPTALQLDVQGGYSLALGPMGHPKIVHVPSILCFPGGVKGNHAMCIK